MRTITTVAELAELAVGTILRGRDGDAVEVFYSGSFQASGESAAFTADSVIEWGAPLRVLWEPEGGERP